LKCTAQLTQKKRKTTKAVSDQNKLQMYRASSTANSWSVTNRFPSSTWRKEKEKISATLLGKLEQPKASEKTKKQKQNKRKKKNKKNKTKQKT
jgi:hypothetical protein